jgi:tetratricopeptide (TPR) repeat protein
MIPITEDGKVTKEIIREGTGANPIEGQRVQVHYTATIASTGVQFDTSRSTGRPYRFKVGATEPKTWSLGIQTMKVGELARFVVPPEYGNAAAGPETIPPDATIIIEAELLDIQETFETDAEGIARANALNDLARVAFSEGRYVDAVAVYQRVSFTIDGLTGPEVDAIRVRTERNLALAFAKVQAWQPSLAHANYVLSQEKDDLRALVRSVDALMNLDRLPEARESLARAMRVSKNDPSLTQLRKQLEDRERAERQRENLEFAKMFRK